MLFGFKLSDFFDNSQYTKLFNEQHNIISLLDGNLLEALTQHNKHSLSLQSAENQIFLPLLRLAVLDMDLKLGQKVPLGINGSYIPLLRALHVVGAYFTEVPNRVDHVKLHFAWYIMTLYENVQYPPFSIFKQLYFELAPIIRTGDLGENIFRERMVEYLSSALLLRELNVSSICPACTMCSFANAIIPKSQSLLLKALPKVTTSTEECTEVDLKENAVTIHPNNLISFLNKFLLLGSLGCFQSQSGSADFLNWVILNGERYPIEWQIKLTKALVWNVVDSENVHWNSLSSCYCLL